MTISKLWTHTYRARCALSQMGTAAGGVRIPVYPHRDEMVRDLAWISYLGDTVGALAPDWAALPDWLSKKKVDALRHPTQMAERMIRGRTLLVRVPSGDCEDWAGLILACGLAGFARRAWLNVAQYNGGATAHAFAEWVDADGPWTASNWWGAKPMAGRPAALFKPGQLTGLVRWPVHMTTGQALVLGWPEVVA